MNTQQLEAEIVNLKSRLDDALAEVSVYNKRNDYVRAADCGRRIIHLADQLHMRTVHLKDMINFYSLINDLQKQGIAAEAVKKLANQT